MPDLAVIMSIYYKDRLAFVKESIESILNQDFSNFHYYITLDGPVQDDVEKYVESLKDERIRLFRLEENKGLAVALNYMLKIILAHPGYNYIARMDADDVSRPERFKLQRDFLVGNPDTTVLGSWYEEIDEEGKHLRYRRLPTEHSDLRKRYYTRTPFAHSSVMFHRRLTEVAGYYPEDTYLMEDNVLWGRALANNLLFANIPELLLKFRIDGNFYNRRSGFKYGLNYMKTKFRLVRNLDLPVPCYFFSLCAGIAKMLPSFVLSAVRR